MMGNKVERVIKDRNNTWIEADAWQNVNKRKYLRRLASKRRRNAGVYLRHETKDILRLAANTHSPSRFTIIRN